MSDKMLHKGLLQEFDESLDHLESLNRMWNWNSIHKNDESDFKEVQDFLKKHGRSYQKSGF